MDYYGSPPAGGPGGQSRQPGPGAAPEASTGQNPPPGGRTPMPPNWGQPAGSGQSAPGWGQPPTGWGPPPTAAPPFATATRHGMPVWAKVLLFVGAAFLLLIVAAVAIPVFLHQRAKATAARTTVQMPATAAGLVRLTDATSLRYEQHLLQAPTPGRHVAAVYGTAAGERRALVLAGTAAMTQQDQAEFLAGAERGASKSLPVPFKDVAPGKLGGSMRCGDDPSLQLAICVFADGGAYGAVDLLGSERDSTRAVEIREQVEHRR